MGELTCLCMGLNFKFQGTAIYYLLAKFLSDDRSISKRHDDDDDDDDNDDDDDDDVFHQVIRGFVHVLQVQTSHVETDTEVLLSCAQSILKNCQGTSQLGSAFYIGSVCQPYVAVTELLEYWIKQSKLNDTNIMVRCLFDVMFEKRQNDLDYEERLFDRGEINTYWDEFDFIQRLDKTIDDNKEILMSKITQDTEVDQQKKDWDNNCDRNEVPTLRTMFLDTHNYQEYVLMILKHSIAHKYKHMMLNLGYNIEDKCFKLLKDGQDWKSAESHYILPSVLVQQMKKT